MTDVRAHARERVATILRHPEAKDRRRLALSLALNTEHSASDALTILAKMPKETPAADSDTPTETTE